MEGMEGESILPPEKSADIVEKARELAVVAYEGKTGPGGLAIYKHCERFSKDTLPSEGKEKRYVLETEDEKIVAWLHDASNPLYSNIPMEELAERMREIGCSEEVITAVRSFARPSGMDYKDWIFYMKRNSLTRKVKALDGLRADGDFKPENEKQQQAWLNAHTWLTSDEMETEDMTKRIAGAITEYNLPDYQKPDSYTPITVTRLESNI